MRTLDECKAAIRRLSVEDRAALILWLSHGMPKDERQPIEPTPTQKGVNHEKNREQERLASQAAMRHFADFKFTEPERRQIRLNEIPPPPPPIPQ
jgi:hypothetical protein